VTGLVPAGLGGADQLAGLGDRGVPVGFGGGDTGSGVSAGRLDRGVPVGVGGRAGGLGLLGAGLGGSELGGHLLRGGVGLRAPLAGFGGALLGGGRAGFGGGGALLGGRPDGFHLGFGGGRVGDRLDGLVEPGGDVGDPVGFGAQQAQQFRAGDPGHGYRRVGIGRGPGRRGGQAPAFPPGGDLGVTASLAVFRGAARPSGGRRGRGAAGVLARVPGRGGSGIAAGHRRASFVLFDTSRTYLVTICN